MEKECICKQFKAEIPIGNPYIPIIWMEEHINFLTSYIKKQQESINSLMKENKELRNHLCPKKESE